MKTTQQVCAITMLLIACATAGACPMCKDAVTTTSAADSAGASIAPRAQGFYYSIVLMVSVPVVLLGGVTTALLHEMRSAKRRLPAHAHGRINTPHSPA